MKPTPEDVIERLCNEAKLTEYPEVCEAMQDAVDVIEDFLQERLKLEKQLFSPFKNDPYALVWIAFRRLYPAKDCEVEWMPGFGKTEDGEHDVYGLTTFADDGRVIVTVSSDLTVNDAIEIFAHELAHVAVGAEADHDERWKAAFDAIFNEYFLVCKEVLPDMVFDKEDTHESNLD